MAHFAILVTKGDFQHDLQLASRILWRKQTFASSKINNSILYYSGITNHLNNEFWDFFFLNYFLMVNSGPFRI